MVVQHAIDIHADLFIHSGDLVIRFNLTGGAKSKDYPDLNFKKIRHEMPPVLECQFAIKAGKRWYLR